MAGASGVSRPQPATHHYFGVCERPLDPKKSSQTPLGLELEQAAVADATESHTDRMGEQQLQAILALDKDLVLSQALTIVIRRSSRPQTQRRSTAPGASKPPRRTSHWRFCGQRKPHGRSGDR